MFGYKIPVFTGPGNGCRYTGGGNNQSTQITSEVNYITGLIFERYSSDTFPAREGILSPKTVQELAP
jgi:hypothetical protein